MDLTTILLVLIVLCASAAGVLAWLLHRQGEPIFPTRRRPPPRQAPAAQTRPLASADVQPPPAAAPAPPPPPAAAPAPPPVARLDPADPAVARLEAVRAQVAAAEGALRGVPEGFQERASLRGELMAIDQHLAAVREGLGAERAADREAQLAELEWLAGRLDSILGDAARIAAGMRRLAEREQALATQALALRDELTTLERRTPFPRGAGPIMAAAADILGRAGAIPSRHAIGGLGALSCRLREAEGLLMEVINCRAWLATLSSGHTHLMALLQQVASPAASAGAATDVPPGATLRR